MSRAPWRTIDRTWPRAICTGHLGSLAHPLPAGMRDLLPEEARRRRSLAAAVLEHFALHGYHHVTPPAFEFADVLERGLGTLDPSDVLRFVEPESGEVAALRPDMTPQIARMVATRLANEPLPIRLCYEGTIVRRRQGRARRDRQVPQAGVELYGVGSLGGDLEMLALAASVMRAVGLHEFVLDVGHASIARGLLEAVPGAPLGEITDALVHKDGARIEAIVASEGTRMSAPIANALVALPHLHGASAGPEGDALFENAQRVLSGTPGEAPFAELAELRAAARRTTGAGVDLSSVLRFDFGEVRGFAYYTGVIFHVLAPGPGEPIAAGGRYDDLLGRFDSPMPATGFALHLDAMSWARESAGLDDPPRRRVLVALATGAAELASALRALGIAAALHDPAADALRYAGAWCFTHLVHDDGGALRITLLTPEGTRVLETGGASEPLEVARILAEMGP